MSGRRLVPDIDVRLNLVVVGDTNVGKSSLIYNYLYNQFDEFSGPSLLNIYRSTKRVKGQDYLVEIHDTSGDELHRAEFSRSYKDADAFIICIAANDPVSFEHVKKWKIEI